MATAKEQAQADLGDIKNYVNYAGYDKERAIAQSTYDTALQSMKNEYDTLMNTINANRQELNRDFTSGRAGAADTYYSNQRLLTPTRSRVLKGTGLSNLGSVVNRMKVGNELSNMANTFYSGMDETDATIKAGELNYDINKRTAKDTYDAVLADIGARQQASENDYNARVASLAEQIQSRWDSNANAKAQLALQQKALAQQKAAAKDAKEQYILGEVAKAAGDPSASEYASNYAKAIQVYKQWYPDATDDEVLDALNRIGVYTPVIATQKQEEAKAAAKAESQNNFLDYMTENPIGRAITKTGIFGLYGTNPVLGWLADEFDKRYREYRNRTKGGSN